MSFNITGFAPSEVDLGEEKAFKEGFDPIPMDWYQVIVMDLAQSTDGVAMVVHMKILQPGGKFNNRQVWWRINLYSQNADYAKLAGVFLAKLIMVTVGNRPLQDESELINVPFLARIATEGEFTNVKDVKNAAGQNAHQIQKGIPVTPSAPVVPTVNRPAFKPATKPASVTGAPQVSYPANNTGEQTPVNVTPQRPAWMAKKG